MRKGISVFLLCISLLVSSFPVWAAENEIQTIEYLSSGDYIVTTLYENTSPLRTAKSGTRTTSYYTHDDTLVFTLILTATYDYTYGVRSEAISAEASVYIFLDSASFIEKEAYVSGNTAYATAVVHYAGTNIRLNSELSCDIYGKLS